MESSYQKLHLHTRPLPSSSSYSRQKLTSFQFVYMSDLLWNELPENTLMLGSPPSTENSLRGGVRIIGSSEGLICFLKDSILYLWNPFIRIMKTIPAGEIPISENNMDFDFAPRSCETTLGFGCSGGDHRVVKLLWEANHIAEVEIYLLWTDSWRRIISPSALEIFLEKRGLHDKSYWFYQFQLPMVTYKGFIYWLGCWDTENEHNPVYKIVRLDLDKELFDEMEAPRSDKLAVVDGCLVLLRFMSERGKVLHVETYIQKESESGSSFWACKNFYFPKEATDTVYYEKTTTGGHIMLARKDGTIFSYYCYCDDDNNLRFKFREFGINIRSCNFDLIPVQETLLLPDKEY